MKKLIVVMVSWNTKQLTHDCLQSLFTEIQDIEAEVWLVDNGSTDGSVELFKSEYPQIRLIENQENVGFAKANNQILREAQGRYYLLLNTDTVVPPGSIRALIDFMDAHPNAAAAGPQLKNAEGVRERPLKPLPSLGGELRYCLSLHCPPFEPIFRTLFKRLRPSRPVVTEPTEAEFLSAACLLIRKETFDTVGYLTEDFFLFSEENDFFYRMQKADLKGFFLPGVPMVHLLGRSRTKRGAINSEINFFRSRMCFFAKHHRPLLPFFKLIYLVFLSWSFVFTGLTGLLTGPSDNERHTLYSELLKVLTEN